MASGDPAVRLIVAAALDQELAPLKSRSLPNLQLLKTGVGVGNADRALRCCLEHARPRVVLGIGFAGGLSPKLRVGDVLLARNVRGSSLTLVSAALLAAAAKISLDGTTIHFGTVITVNEILGKASLKRSLAGSLESGELGCVDMESLAIAQVCSEYRLPFLIARCITDGLGEDLPIDFDLCRKSDGSIDTGKVLRSAFFRPQALPALWQLHKRSKYCAENLALFVEKLLKLAAPGSASC
jgi:adenosylhomocysteine nucleosidase